MPYFGTVPKYGIHYDFIFIKNYDSQNSRIIVTFIFKFFIKSIYIIVNKFI